jgi:hypothetical protein
MRKNDPHGGVTTSIIVNPNTQEPDPSPLVPPSDWTVVDEAASFTITFGER